MDCAVPRLLPSALLPLMAQAPAHCALRFRGKTYTNADLLQKVQALTTALRSLPLTEATAVAVAMPRSPELLACLLALWQCGAIYVPLDPSLPRERLQQQLQGARVQLIITQPALADAMASFPLPTIVVTPLDASCTATTALSAPATVLAESPAYVMFTSGSSGPPKAVLLSHGNLATFFAAVAAQWKFPSGLRYLVLASPGFDISLFELLAPLLFRGTAVIADTAESTDPGALLQLLRDESLDVVQATPSHWHLLCQQPMPSGWRIPLALSIGEALSKTLARQLLQHTDQLWNLYGPTECTIWATAHRVGDEDTGEHAPAIVCLGQALPAYHAQVLPDGELLLAGQAVALGYANDHTLAAARFVLHADERSYRTGDLCRLDSAGLLHFLGRNDQQIKLAGHRIELDEIEQRLQAHSSVAQAACALRPLASGTGQLLAFLVCKPGAPNKDAQRFNAWLASTLPAWMLPHRYLIVDRLPLSANGKLDRRKLLALAEQDAGNRSGEATALANKVASVFCEILELPSVGHSDSFFDLGGTSMLSASLILSLNQRFHARLSLRQALQTPPTVNSLVSLLQSQGVSE